MDDLAKSWAEFEVPIDAIKCLNLLLVYFEAQKDQERSEKLTVKALEVSINGDINVIAFSAILDTKTADTDGLTDLFLKYVNDHGLNRTISKGDETPIDLAFLLFTETANDPLLFERLFHSQHPESDLFDRKKLLILLRTEARERLRLFASTK